MNRKLILGLALAVAGAPFAALAMPALGDVVGTNPEAATAALKAAGCTLRAFEAEGGKIEAKCTDDATGKRMEVYIDPASGKITRIKSGD